MQRRPLLAYPAPHLREQPVDVFVAHPIRPHGEVVEATAFDHPGQPCRRGERHVMTGRPGRRRERNHGMHMTHRWRDREQDAHRPSRHHPGTLTATSSPIMVRAAQPRLAADSLS